MHACHATFGAAYLFNRTESHSLPSGIMPYEQLHSLKPNVEHLQVFGARCFVRIPTELQEKLGPRSCKAIFMGYPPGVKAWRCQDSITGACFNSRDVVFDETFDGHPFPAIDSDDNDDIDSMVPVRASIPPSIPPAPPASPPPCPPRRSGCTQNPTDRGRLYHEQLANDAAHLHCQRDLRQARI